MIRVKAQALTPLILSLLASLGRTVTVKADAQAAPSVQLAYLWSDKPLARTGDTITFSAFIENSGDVDAQDLTVELQAPKSLALAQSRQSVEKLAAGSYQRIDWQFKPTAPGSIELSAILDLPNTTTKPAHKTYRILVLDRTASPARQELCTDEAGFWHLLEKPTALQAANSNPLTSIAAKTSSQLKHSPYGLCVQLPRSRDYEDPFNPSHLIDGDSQTCWSSQQRPSSYPGNPPSVQIDLGRPLPISQINLIPYWNNTDFPVGFTILASSDAEHWRPALRIANHRFDRSGPTRGDKIAQLFPIAPLDARYLRFEFQRLPLSGGNYAEVSQGYKARLSGIEVLDPHGHNLALAQLGVTITASDTFTGWQNTARSVNESFDRLFDLGVKWVRVGQWGDQTEWAAVERQKGVFRMDPATDAAINKLHANGVEILFGLQYGNSLYERPDKPFIDCGPIFQEGHPFYLNTGPRSEAGRQAFCRYVDFVVRKYKDRISCWEVWNEENGWYPGHEPDYYGQLLAAAAKQIKSIDPNLKVIFGGTAAPAPLTTEIALRHGAASFLDAYAFHPYCIDKPEGGMGTMEQYQGKDLSQSRQQTGWNRLEDIVAGVKKPFAQHGRPDMQVWLDEWGTNVAGLDYTYRPGLGEYACAKYLMRFYVYSGWLNLPTAWWALYNQNFSQDWGIIDPHDYSLRPPSYALRNLCTILSDVEPVASLDYHCDPALPDPKVIAYRRDTDHALLVAAWSADLNTDQVRSYPTRLSFAVPSPPAAVTLTDLYWGISQPAQWTYVNGQVILDGLILHDYPIVICCQ